jgi:hypothetical protein
LNLLNQFFNGDHQKQIKILTQQKDHIEAKYYDMGEAEKELIKRAERKFKELQLRFEHTMKTLFWRS